jgi:cytochrome c oxidase cbb3-type subunit 4
MDYGTLRGLFTLLIFALFIVIVIWAFSKSRKSSFDEIAGSILDDDLPPENNKKQSKQETNKNV